MSNEDVKKGDNAPKEKVYLSSAEQAKRNVRYSQELQKEYERFFQKVSDAAFDNPFSGDIPAESFIFDLDATRKRIAKKLQNRK